MVEFVDTSEPLSESYLNSYEQRPGAKLPVDYRTFLMTHNGGRPRPNHFDVQVDDTTHSLAVSQITALVKDARTVVGRRRIYTVIFPGNLLPVAFVWRSGYLCLSIRGEDYGKLYLWDNEWQVSKGAPDYKTFHLVAHSFGEFLDLLYEPEKEPGLKVVDSFEPISEMDLTAFERELGIQLPDDYCQFLLAHNGGDPDPYCFDIDMGSFINGDSIQYFLGLVDGELYSISRYLNVYAGRVPNNFFPIAPCSGGDLVCLSVRGEDYGKVYYWDHNWEVTEAEPDYSNVHLLADNFTAFLDMLYDLDDES